MNADANPSITRGYVAVTAGEAGRRLVHYRVCGSGPAVVLLHDSPRSSRLHLPLMHRLAARFRVHALDTPGYGNSDPLGTDTPTIPDFAQALGSALDALGLDRAPLYATHTSAKIALALAARGGRMPLLLLDGLSIPDQPAADSFIASYMRPFAPEETGAWLGAEWSRTRDMLRWFPWFATAPQNRIAMAPPSAAWMEDYGIDLFSAGPHYADAYAAAMRWSPLDDLHAVTVPTVVGARTDDVLYPHLDKVPCAANPALSVMRLTQDRDTWADWIADTLAAATTAGSEAALLPPLARNDASRGYTAHENGQIHWQRYPGPAGGNHRPLMILSAPTTLEAHDWARAMSRHCPVIVPDLPGFGDSDALPQASAEAIADLLAMVIGRLEPEPCHVLAIGLAAPLGAMMAARRPGLVAGLAVWGAPAVGTPANAALCPEVPFDPHAGTHLHRFWHMLRDSAVQWPWHDGRPEAARPAPALPDPLALHRALTGLLKQRTEYGSAVAAALGANEAALWQSVKVPALVAHGPDPAPDPAMASAADLVDLLPRGAVLAIPAMPDAVPAALHWAFEQADGRTQREASAT